MKQLDNDYVRNEFDEIDINYYLSKARQLRNQAIRESFFKLGGLVKQRMHSVVILFYKADARLILP